MNQHNFFERHAENWDTIVRKKELLRIKKLIRTFNIRKNENILDAGCGTGILLPMLKKNAGKNGKIIALDYSMNMLSRAKKKFKNKFKYICADIGKIPIKDSFFDKVICFSSFPHFRNKKKSLHEINRVLKTGGKLIIFHAMGRKKLNDFHLKTGKEVARDMLPSGYLIKSLLKRSDFTIEKYIDKSSGYLVIAGKNS